MKVNMLEQNLNVLTPAEFVFLENRKRDGVYNHETREKLYSIIEKLQRGKRNNSREEKKLYKIFRDANFGILLDKNSRTREKIIHSGKVQILAKFEGEIIAQAVLIEKTASIAATIAAEVVMCKGRVFGEIRATYKIKIAKGGEVKGYVHTPNFIIEKGAVFDGRCSMPRSKKPSALRLLRNALKKTG
jgi:cytoskeletal protein CcmA (bactofilin family)